jgi:phosphatidylethanolamine-binding protein (PEBP) family uncharacterized protein
VQTAIAAPAILSLALAGCGGSSARSSPSPTETSSGRTPSSAAAQHASNRSEPQPTASMEVSIPTESREEDLYIPRRYTCDGADISPPVRWSRVPPATAQLAIFVINLQPVHGNFVFDWAVAGISPTSHGISAGTLPPGAVIGRNSYGKTGYSICPIKGAGKEHYVVRVLALPHPLSAKPGFDAETVYRRAERAATVVGLAGGAYKRS